MLLVGVPAMIELPTARLLAALSMSVIFLVVQFECKPYATAEHNVLAELAGAQITGTLLFISMQSSMPIPQFAGFLCIVLNVMAIPLVICFNARRLKRRKDILDAFLRDHEVVGKVQIEHPIGPKEEQTSAVNEFFDPLHFSEYWKAGQRSEHEVFCATLKWMDAALERPVSNERWGQLLFTLEQLPLTSSEDADVRHGAWWLASVHRSLMPT